MDAKWGPEHSTSLALLRHNIRMDTLHNKSPALTECILFPGSNSNSPKLVQQDPSEKKTKKPVRELLSAPKNKSSPYCTSLLPPPPILASASSPPSPPPELGRATTAKSRGARSPRTQTPLPQPHFRAGVLDSVLRLGSGGEERQDIRVPDSTPSPTPNEALGPVKRKREKEAARGFCPSLSPLSDAQARGRSSRASGAPRCVQPAPPPGPSAVQRPQLQWPGARPSAAQGCPHLPLERPGGAGIWGMPQAGTLGAIDIGSPTLSAHRACAEPGVPPRPANHHTRRHACALATRRPNRPLSKLRDPPLAITKGHWHPIRIEVVVGGSWKSSSQ